MPTPIASEVPRLSTPSSTPSPAQTAKISQPAAIARTSSQADGQHERDQNDAERRQLGREYPQSAGALREERLERVPAVLAAEREDPEHEREDAPEQREPGEHIAHE